jgi:uncharacterized SAM-binding protein YcdF (DUF218 family)
MTALALSYAVDEAAIFPEGRSTNTRENLFYAAEIMREYGWEKALIVTDYFHMRRAILIAGELGIQPMRAPVFAEASYYAPAERFRYTLRECAALIHYTAGKLFR